MMTYTREPKAARPVLVIEGKRQKDGVLVNLYITRHHDTYYTTWYIEEEVIYRHQYSGKNIELLRDEIDELRAGLLESHEAGEGIPQ